MKILFVCLGNICRSSAAEEIMRTLVRRAGLEWAYRIWHEPKQFWRYAKNGAYFLYRSAREDLLGR